MESKKLITIIISGFSLIFLLCFSGFKLYSYNHNNNAVNYYKQGLEYYSKNDFQNAYYNFSKISFVSDIYPNALFKCAKSADMINDYKTAIRNYRLFDFILKDKNISPFILWRIGNLYFDNGKIQESKKTFLKLIKLYPESEYGIASYYMLSKIDDAKKREYLVNYIKYSPKGKYSTNVSEELLKNKDELNVKEALPLANSLYENEKYIEAIDVYKDIPIEYSWVSLVKLLDKINSKKNIIKVVQKGITLDNSHYDEDTLSEVIEIYADSNITKLKSYDYIYSNAKDRRIKAIALFKSSYLLNNDGFIKRNLLLSEKFPDSKFAPYALYNLFIEAYKENKIPLALKYGKKHLALYKDKNLTPNVLYFAASLKKKIQDGSYKELFNRLMKEYPNNYFAYRAYSKEINKNFAKKRDLKIRTKLQKINYPYGENKKTAMFFENFSNMNDLDVYEDFRIQNILIKSWIEYKKGNRALSSVYARDYINNSDILPSRSHIVWKLAYPVYYPELINKYSEINNLNPYLILSLIKEESHFNPSIQSYVGATGLMQIMPSTAHMVSGINYKYGDLINEELNIKLGTKYFKYLMDVFSNNEMLCILGYNSGPNAVLRWIKKEGNVPFDILVENIPYGETKNYVKKVYSAYWNYLLTYEKIKI